MFFQLHLEARAAGVRGLRSTEKLLDDVASTLEEKFGVRKRVTDLDQNRKRGARNMVNERRALRGLPPEEFGEERPTPRAQSRDGDRRPVSDTTPEEYTRSQFGYGRDTDDAVDVQMHQSRKKRHPPIGWRATPRATATSASIERPKIGGIPTALQQRGEPNAFPAHTGGFDENRSRVNRRRR